MGVRSTSPEPDHESVRDGEGRTGKVGKGPGEENEGFSPTLIEGRILLSLEVDTTKETDLTRRGGRRNWLKGAQPDLQG